MAAPADCRFFEVYEDSLQRFVFRSGFLMKPLITKARAEPKARDLCRGRGRARPCARPRYCSKTRIAKPILIGRPSVVETRLKRFGLSIRPGEDFELVQSGKTIRAYRDYVATYLDVAGAQGHHARCRAHAACAPNSTVIGAIAVRRGDADCADLRAGGALRLARYAISRTFSASLRACANIPPCP